MENKEKEIATSKFTPLMLCQPMTFHEAKQSVSTLCGIETYSHTTTTIWKCYHCL